MFAYRCGASVKASTVLTRLILDISSSLDITKPLTLTKPSGLGAILDCYSFLIYSLSSVFSIWSINAHKPNGVNYNRKRIVFSENDSLVENFKNSS